MKICILMGCAVIAACAPNFPPRPYVEGRLLHPAFIEIAGRPNEINEIKAYASTRGWQVDCEGVAGDQATLRLRFPQGTRQDEIEGYFADITRPRGSKNQMVYYGMQRSRGCVTLP